MRMIHSSSALVLPITDKDTIIPHDLWSPAFYDERFSRARPGGVTVL